MSTKTEERYTGLKNLEIGLLRGGRVVLTASFATPYEAALAYEDFIEAAKTGELKLTFSTGKRTK